MKEYKKITEVENVRGVSINVFGPSVMDQLEQHAKEGWEVIHVFNDESILLERDAINAWDTPLESKDGNFV